MALDSGKRIRLATFNVHCFVDAHGRNNLDRVKSLIQRYHIDILCLQEAGKSMAQKLFREAGEAGLGFAFLALRGSCAILSKFPQTQIDCHEGRKRKYWPRYVNVKLKLSKHLVVSLTNLHLTHRLEPQRMKEMEMLTFDLHNHARQNRCSLPRIFAGDFNALTLEDYTVDELEEIERIRADGKWEKPMRQVTDYMKTQLQCVDAREVSDDCSGPLSTCRFNTRIDYFFIDKRVKEELGLQVTRVEHVEDDASDHNMVIMDLQTER